MQLVQKTIYVNDHKISYLDGGKSSDQKHPILFLHGWGLTSKSFEAGLSILSRNHRVLAPDLPGCGGSHGSISHWNYEDFARVIGLFIEAVGVKRVHLMGQSMGGGISIVLTTLAPSLVSSLILIDSAGIPLDTFSNIFRQRLIELPVQAWATRFTWHHFGMIQAILYNSILRTRNTIDSLRLSLSVDLRPILSCVNAPCLILWGANDRATPLSSGQALKQAIGGAKLIVIQNAHHEWSTLMPEKFSAVVSEFVTGLEKK
jgi:pimeloyl-ACP methyl ester carboxylesterase